MRKIVSSSQLHMQMNIRGIFESVRILKIIEYVVIESNANITSAIFDEYAKLSTIRTPLVVVST